jgi:hypothetical protein
MAGMGNASRVLRNKSRKELLSLWEHVVTETDRAWDHWDLWGGIDAALDDIDFPKRTLYILYNDAV